MPAAASRHGLAPTFFADVHPGRGAQAALVEALRRAIGEGRLDSGTTVPSSRVLAAELGVARQTVVNAYAELITEGWLTARPGSGTQVATPSRMRPATAPPPTPPVAESPRWDLRPGRAEQGSFPASAWVRTMHAALADAPDDVLDFGDQQGVAELRTQIARYLGRRRGLRIDPADVVVFTGGRQALSNLMRCFRLLGADTVGLEDPANPLYGRLAHGAGLTVCRAPVDEHGVAPERFLTHPGRLGGVIVNPSHQFPLGPALRADRRRLLVEWARDTGAYLIEDDYGTEFRTDRTALPPLQLDGPDVVVFGGTSSRTLAPGLRISWIVAPPRLHEVLLDQRRLLGGQGSELDQLTLARFFADGAYDRHLRKMGHRYQRRAVLLHQVLAQCRPAVRVSGTESGAHALVDLPLSGPTEAAVLAAARARGVAVHGLRADGYLDDGAAPPRPALIVGFTTPPERAYPAAVRELAAAVDAATT